MTYGVFVRLLIWGLAVVAVVTGVTAVGRYIAAWEKEARKQKRLSELEPYEEWKRKQQQKRDAYYKTPEWRAKRRRILERDGNKCRWCGQPAREVHHTIYREDHKEPDRTLISLCLRCHEGATGRPLNRSY
jgi:5-methylcytosine-specific restriction endonuclease McrA